MPTTADELYTLGNSKLLTTAKTAFFCSRDYPDNIRQATYLWALEQRFLNRCILSGFHSSLAQEIFRYLLTVQHHPIIYVLGRGIQSTLRYAYEPELADGRLLFVSPFEGAVTNVTKETGDIRNMLLADLADDFFIPYLDPAGNLDRLFSAESLAGKVIYTLNIPENKALLQRGAQPYRPSSFFGRQAGAAASARARL